MEIDPRAPSRLRQSLRFDGLWWRKLAMLGSVYGPEWWKLYSPPFFAAAIFAIVGRNRRGAVSNLQRILGNTGNAVTHLAALRMFSEFSHCMTETLEYYGPLPKPVRIDPPTAPSIGDALAAGRGAVVVTGHFGNWDIAAKGLREYGRPINLVMARDVNQTTTEFVRAAREAAGVQVIYSDSSVFSTFNMIRALRRNEVVAMQLDRPLSLEATSEVPFFGAPARFPNGPFVLARVAGAPLVPVFIPRLGTRHYETRVFDAFHVTRDAGSLEAAMVGVVGVFEKIIREFPTQWFQFAPFWSQAVLPPRNEPLAASGLDVRARAISSRARQTGE